MSKQPTTTTFQHPVTFDEFDAIYRAHLADTDAPSCYIAYCRAEDDVHSRTGARRWKNYQTFVNTRTRRNREQKNAALPIESGRAGHAKSGTKTDINCQLCDTTLYTVPRGDLRTIIPHFCESCREEIKKLIFV